MLVSVQAILAGPGLGLKLGSRRESCGLHRLGGVMESGLRLLMGRGRFCGVRMAQPSSLRYSNIFAAVEVNAVSQWRSSSVKGSVEVLVA